jgi:hypothetical protein
MLKDAHTDSSGSGSCPSRVTRTARAISLHQVSSKGAFLLGASFLSMLLGAATLHAATFTFRLSPGPRLVGTRAASSGGGSVQATLQGSELTLQGSYHGLLAVPTGAHLCMGSLPGVRGPLVADLTISPATNGTLNGSVELNAQQLGVLRKGGFYVEIDSDKAPDGDLWGWLYPFEQSEPSDRQ